MRCVALLLFLFSLRIRVIIIRAYIANRLDILLSLWRCLLFVFFSLLLLRFSSSFSFEIESKKSVKYTTAFNMYNTATTTTTMRATIFQVLFIHNIDNIYLYIEIDIDNDNNDNMQTRTTFVVCF